MHGGRFVAPLVRAAFAFLLLVLVATTTNNLPLVSADDLIIQKRVEDSDLAAMFDPKRKKPFCNAFTGCGRKRSDESMAALVDLNSEPAVEELSRQILSEAKLWEAIQEARRELTTSTMTGGRHHTNAQQQVDTREGRMPFSMSGMRKRRSVIEKDWNPQPK